MGRMLVLTMSEKGAEGGVGVGLKGSPWLLGGALRRAGRDQGPVWRLLSNPHRTLPAAGTVSSGGVWVCLVVGLVHF